MRLSWGVVDFFRDNRPSFHCHTFMPTLTLLPPPNRRSALRIFSAAALGLGLSHCGFAPRGVPHLVFSSLYLQANDDKQLAYLLSQQLSYIPNLTITQPPEKWSPGKTEVILEILNIQNERIVMAKTASGQVRELELRLSLHAILKDGKTLEPLAPAWPFTQRREMSYNESLALAKDEEEKAQQIDMRRSIARQIIRQLSLASPKGATSP